jgi:thiol:disulfide interchange protein
MIILRNLLYSLILMVGAMDAHSQFNDKDTILKAEEAFVLSGFHSGNIITASWQIAQNHYLYKDSIKVFVNNNLIEHEFISLLNEEMIVDEFFGKSLVLKNTVVLKATYTKDNLSTAIIKIAYQGCAEGKYCYPKQLKTI